MKSLILQNQHCFALVDADVASHDFVVMMRERDYELNERKCLGPFYDFLKT